VNVKWNHKYHLNFYIDEIRMLFEMVELTTSGYGVVTT